MFLFILDLVILIGLAALVTYAVLRYRESPGTASERLFAVGQGSATVLWSIGKALVGAVGVLVTSTADFFDMPGVTDTIKSMLQPEYVSLALIAIAAVTYLARKRTL